jgi:Type ISP C-terminal specificity domain
MELLVKAGSNIDIRKPYKRLPRTFQSMSQASGLIGSRLAKHALISETNVAVKELVSKRSEPLIVTYPIEGGNKIDCISYAEPDQNTNKGLVWINQTQYFENVPSDVWNFCLDNYYICQKWLKAREGAILDRQSIQNYQRLVIIVSETVSLMTNVNSQLMRSYA